MKTAAFFATLFAGVSAWAQIGFIFEPVGMTASVGANALFLGTAYGFEPVSYQWRRDGEPIAGETADYLYLQNLGLDDAGDYDVVVSTASFGSITSQVATLVVDATFTKVTADPLVNQGGNSLGSAWGDFDNDGDLDVFVPRAGTDFNSLFRNNGDGSFTKLDAPPVTTDLSSSQGAIWADYDNDGWLDLFVFNSTTASTGFLYHNEGAGSFSRANTGPGADAASITTAAWADYDRDGWLDIVTAPIGGFGPGGGGGASGLYRNVNGALLRQTNALNAGFALITAQAAAWADYDSDGDADLLFATVGFGTFLPGNEVLFNNTPGGFVTIGANALVTNGTPSATVAWGDYDNDGDLDVYVGNPEGTLKGLFRYTDGEFESMSGEIVEEEGDIQSAAWGDYDNDGWLDMFVANVSGGSFLFHNNADGTFTKIGAGSVTGDIASSTAGAWVDVDNDGDLDLFVSNVSDNNFLYLNNGNSNGWLTVNCIGFPSNRSAVGAKVRLLATINGVEQWQLREIGARDSRGSPNSLRAEFGLGDATNITLLRVEWPSGLVSELHDVAPRQFLTVVEPATITAVDAAVMEGDFGTRALNFGIRLSSVSTNTVSVDFTTADGTALAGTDYEATNGTVVIPPGVTNVVVPVAVLGNLTDQPNRTFSLVLSNPTNMPIAFATAVGTILDDDPLVLNVDNAFTTEGDEGITDMLVPVSLNKEWHEPVSFDFTLSGVAAAAGVDYVATNGTHTLLPGETNKPLRIPLIGDLLSERDESFFVNLSNVQNAMPARTRAIATIVDNDPLPLLSVADARQVEGNSGNPQLVFTATLSAPAGRNVMVSYVTTNGSALAPSDYTSQTAILTITAGAVTGTISIPVKPDTIPEGDEVMYLRLSNPQSVVLANTLATGTIVDDDFRVLPPAVNGEGSRFAFGSISNRLHRVEFTSSLTPPVEWLPVSGQESVLGNGAAIEVIDPGATNAMQRFYRIVLLP